MKRSLIFILIAIVLTGILFVVFQDQFTSDISSTDGVKTTEILIYSNCPIEESTIRDLVTVYQDSSCPKIQIIRMDLPAGQNTGTIAIPISFMNKFRANLFPLPIDFLMEDVSFIKSKPFESNITDLIKQKQGNTDCLHDSIKTKWIADTVFQSIKVLDSVNQLIKVQKKNKVIFKVIGCGKGKATTDDKDGDGFKDKDDKCPDDKGTVRGCPDSDGDGFADIDETCDDTPGNCDGCTDIINMNAMYETSTGMLNWDHVQNCKNYKITVTGSKPGKRIESLSYNTSSNYIYISGIKASVWNGCKKINITISPELPSGYSANCLKSNVCEPNKLNCDS
jgi:hypothetical protein